jgi:hypothetical protein
MGMRPSLDLAGGAGACGDGVLAVDLEVGSRKYSSIAR